MQIGAQSKRRKTKAGFLFSSLAAALTVMILPSQTSAQQIQQPAVQTEATPIKAQSSTSLLPPKPKKVSASDGQKAAGSKGDAASNSWQKSDFSSFIDSRQRLQAPDPALIDKGLRFLTADNFAPFNSLDKQGEPRGYHIDLARLICEELNIACTVKVVPFHEIPSLLAQGKADAALAGLASHPSIRDKVGFSATYLQRPARFIIRDGEFLRTTPMALAEKPIAVIGRSAHEAYLKAYFPKIKRIAVADLEDAQALLKDEKVEAIFADALSITPRIASPSSNLRFAGLPYLDQHFFGEGMAIAYQREQMGLRNLLDHALVKLAQKGRLAELYARHIPVDIYTRY